MTCTKCRKRPRRAANQRWCNRCHAEHQRLTRRTYGELTDEQRMKLRARSIARRALASGKIARPAHCELEGCRKRKTVMHHADYSLPLKVDFFCERCHRKLHWLLDATRGATEAARQLSDSLARMTAGVAR